MSSPPAPSGSELVGAVLSRRFRLARLVGTGAMGAVYASDQVIDGSPVAIKMLLPEFATDVEVLARFLEEGTTVQRLSHPNIVKVFEAATAEDGSPYIVMELLEGIPLAKYTQNGTPLPILPALNIAREALAGLAAAHAMNVVHRDLKPDNVFLSRTPNGQFSVKLLDFGIAKVMDLAGGMNSKTRTGVLLGTPAYMSPEQVKNAKEVDPRSDLWSLGVLLYEMLTGRSPFPAPNEYARLLSVVNEPAVPIHRDDPRLTPFVPFFERALAKSRDQRFSNAAEMAHALTMLAEPSPSNASHPNLNLATASLGASFPVTPLAPGAAPPVNSMRVRGDAAKRRINATLMDLAEGSAPMFERERRVALWLVAALIFVAFLAGASAGFALARATM